MGYNVETGKILIQILLTTSILMWLELSGFVSVIPRLCAIISLPDNFIKFLSEGNTYVGNHQALWVHNK